jgi:hypothetical protein
MFVHVAQPTLVMQKETFELHPVHNEILDSASCTVLRKSPNELYSVSMWHPQ